MRNYKIKMRKLYVTQRELKHSAMRNASYTWDITSYEWGITSNAWGITSYA